MSEPKPIHKKIAAALTEELSDRGQVVEGGWRAYELMVLKGTSDLQRSECRKAFFCGAQHVWATINNMLGPGMEPTEQDLERMTKLDKELRRFIDELKAARGE